MNNLGALSVNWMDYNRVLKLYNLIEGGNTTRSRKKLSQKARDCGKMCGIICTVLSEKAEVILDADHDQLLHRRGPDGFSTRTIDHIEFKGYVLWQQGLGISEQPIECGNIILLFNGDIFNIDHAKPHGKSDSEWLANTLSTCRDDSEVCSTLRTLEGPYGMIFYNKDSKQLYFARDSLGRNSLIIEKNSMHLRISSTSHFIATYPTKVMELPPLGVFKMDISDPSKCTIFPWSLPDKTEWQLKKAGMENTLGLNISLSHTIDPNWMHISTIAGDSFDFYQLCRHLNNTSTDNLYEELLLNQQLMKELEHFLSLLENSVKDRVQKTPNYCQNCIRQRNACNHSKIAILYSGGIDCSILAVLVNKYSSQKDSIDLINVAFEKVGSDDIGKWDTPDRISARNSYMELRRMHPSRKVKWNFIEVDITRTELHDTLQSHIKHLIYPLNTVLDESIGSAFWFAARGEGKIEGNHYSSSARVIIIGSGADELFGGYIRHKNAYVRCKGNEEEKNASLSMELEKDWHRIPTRNLARDDRVIADTGKSSRAPFIEEHLVKYVRSLSPKQRCCFSLDDGIGDKLFLRLCGYKLGLRAPVFLKKRAIQFGSRIANKKDSATDISKYLKFDIM